ncbi:MAG TPA: hypothetical protein VF215_14085, partial [Thermoanaerobaculia bacterium]
MKKLRTFIALFLLGIGCGKPLAEPQQPAAQAPRAAINAIPSTVSASRRTPIVVVAARSSASSASAAAGAASTSTRTPGRPFFIDVGSVTTSSAPA